MAEDGSESATAGTAAATLPSDSGPSRVRPSPSDGKGERGDAVKRPRRADGDMASRGRRMFGLLNSTLSKAKEDNARRSSGEAARKRAEIEARLQEKLKAEEETIRQNDELVEQLRAQLTLAYKTALDIHSTEAMIRVRRAQKRRLASFLVTPSRHSQTDGEQARRVAVDGRVIAADVASCLAPLPPHHAPDYPVYYLPKRMLPKQDDTLDDQEDRVDDAIEEADQAWEKKKEGMQQDLAHIRGIIKGIRNEMMQPEKGEAASKEKGTTEDGGLAPDEERKEE